MSIHGIRLATGVWLLGVMMVGWIQPFYALILTMIFGLLMIILVTVKHE